MNEPAEFKALFLQTWKLVFLTDIPPQDYGETDDEYSTFCKNYEKVFTDWSKRCFEIYSSRLKVYFLPYLSRRQMTRYSNGLTYVWGPFYGNEGGGVELPLRHRTAPLPYMSGGSPTIIPLLAMGFDINAIEQPNDEIKLYFWNLFHNKARLPLMRNLYNMVATSTLLPKCRVNARSLAKWDQVSIDTMVDVKDKPRIIPGDAVSSIWGMKGKLSKPFPAMWQRYYENGLVYRNWKQLMNGSSRDGYPSEIGFPCFSDEFLSSSYTFPFPQSVDLKFPKPELISAFMEWKNKHYDSYIYEVGVTKKNYNDEFVLFFKKYYLLFQSWLKETSCDKVLRYYECGVQTPYQVYNTGFVFTYFLRLYELSQNDLPGRVSTFWKDLAPMLDLKKVEPLTINNEDTLQNYRPSHIYSEFFDYLKIQWMSTYGFFGYMNRSWLDEVLDPKDSSVGYQPGHGGLYETFIKNEEPEDRNSDLWWEFTVFNFIKKYPILNIQYPSYVSREQFESFKVFNAAKLIEFEQMVTEGDPKGFWKAVLYQWDVYMAWVENNVMASIANYSTWSDKWRPGSDQSVTTDANKKTIANSYPNLGVLSDEDVSSSALGTVLKIIPLKSMLDYIYGGGWWRSVSQFIIDTFIHLLRFLKDVAVAAAKEGVEAVKAILKFLGDNLLPESSTLLMIGGAIAGFVLMFHAAQRKIDSLI